MTVIQRSLPLNFTPLTQALGRLTPGEGYDRAYRLKRACQASVLHAPLDKSEWTPANEVCRN
jgi:ubiquinol-cytochrome c reductase subunit 7